MSARRSKSSKNRLLLVMPYHQLARKAAEAGFRVWSLWDPLIPEADFLSQVADASEELLHTSFADEARLRQLVTQVSRQHNLGTVLHCGSGPSVLPVVEEAWHLGLSPNPPEALRRLREADEPSVEAPRLTVQTLTVDGCHHVVGMATQRTSGPPDFAVTGYLFPAPLSNLERETVEQLVCELLRASGYRFGPAHTEVALTADGPRVVCCQPRLSPDRIPLLIQVASGFDCEAALFDALLGEAPRLRPAHQYAEIGFFPLSEGRLRTYAGTEDIAVTPWVRGARFPYTVHDWIPPATDPRSRRAYVVVEGDSPEITRERVRQARADLVTDIRTEG
ncbi:phosphoribosylglycinamide synthetase [Streptomyces sp. NPDC050428]|uniref:phosphoribosylglycinamide synthetase n=1 Tax=Streptomyces sp. NPDC050428 TaxID=3155757 RepID=UPI0034326B89